MPSNRISCQGYGALPGGAAVELYTLRNAAGMQAQIATYGGILTSLVVPGSAGHLADVVLGYDTLDAYIGGRHYFGALIGRYANRISDGRFTLDGQNFDLSTNERSSSLHGGAAGFDRALWSVRGALITLHGPQITLAHMSRSGEQGYPGDLFVTATYTLLPDALRLTFTATTNKATVVSLTGHSYFNLAGSGDVLGHELQICADRFTPVNSELIPTGELRGVSGTPFDFRKQTTIGARIDADDEQLHIAGGYDHNWVLNGEHGTLRLDAVVYDPCSGRVMELLSDQPGLQFYSGNSLDSGIEGKDHSRYGPRRGFCLEPQQFPNAPNESTFPSPTILPGRQYRCTILYRFSVRTTGAIAR
jgi:aldose 1-epimerase